jgi:hypothetical protein
LCVWGGNGMTENLMCSGSREWLCWNSIGFNGMLAVQRLVETISAELYRLEGFDAQFRALVTQASQEGGTNLAKRWDDLNRGEETQARKKDNLTAAIAEYGPKPMFEQQLTEIEAIDRELARERRRLETWQNRTLQLPESVSELHRMLEEKFQTLAQKSQEFGNLMRQLVPEFHVYLVRLCDGGHLLPRAKVKLNLAGIIPDVAQVPGMEAMLTRELTLDLFDPPQREQVRAEAVRLTSEGLTQRQITQRIPDKPTQTAVQRALALDRKMRGLGLSTPYVTVLEPPADYTKLRRHLNPKYQFKPLEGYIPPAI